MPETTETLPTETVEQPKPTEPQVQEPVDEPFDKERAMKTIQAQREENKVLKARAKKADELEALEKQRADAELTESERLKKEKTELELENKTIKSNLMRPEVISVTGLPAVFADRLKGESKEEMLADAEALVKTLPQLKVAPKLPPTNPNQALPNETDVQKRERLFGRQGNNIFDVDWIKSNGGGVVEK